MFDVKFIKRCYNVRCKDATDFKKRWQVKCKRFESQAMKDIVLESFDLLDFSQEDKLFELHYKIISTVTKNLKSKGSDIVAFLIFTVDFEDLWNKSSEYAGKISTKNNWETLQGFIQTI